MKKKSRRRRVRTRSLETLLRDGHWGQLRPGISRQAAAKLLGVPPRWQRSTAELAALRAGTPVAGWALSEVLQYDAIELHFTDDPASRCIRLFCDNLDALHTGTILPVAPSGFSEGMTEAAVLAQLARAGLSATRVAFPPAPRQIRLVLESGARLGLTDDPAFFEPGTPGAGQRLFCVEVEASRRAVVHPQSPHHETTSS